ncbi:tetratricopeptide repeat protein [Tolypothrix sp. PCC 7910]|uniref:CHAT domain-containing protein n=1 Tax=Tolypothrix sp. PCC 7910 TaxID=2099387 RepID=UPI0014277AA2|nr:CHAT domain-containing protein [Tolypothrix sp. PCC 7910]QIR37495.1 tetratricopeptide repeat protein [Tolypothrix sp. PCC 7910]
MLGNFFQRISRKIAAKLGLSSSPNNEAPKNPISNPRLEFLLQVLKATYESKGNAEVIHPLLQAKHELLDMAFAEVLRNWATATLANLEIEQAQGIASVIGNFSIQLQDFPLGNRANNLEIAITGYEIALTVFTQDSFPYEWATTQNNLGEAYRNRIKGEKAENLELAIQYNQQALLVHTRDRFPYEWAMTQNNLGNAYWECIKGEKAENLELAIQSYQQALLVRTRDRFPYEWAMTQNNLGNAYSNRIKGEKAENLELAIQSYQVALLEYTRDRFPDKWAMTQNNLGNAYSNRIKGEKAENLELAIQSYQAALLIRTRDRFPSEWAMTQNNLGNAYSNRIKGEKAENLELAIQYNQQALLEFTRDRFPYEWATTQNNLGATYYDRIQGEKAENLELAIQYNQQALLEFTRDRFPIEWARTQNNLGAAYSDRIKGEKAENLELAIQCNQAALLEFTRDRFPIEWARTQNNLGAAYYDRIQGEKAKNLELAIQSYQAALLEYTRDRFPIDWAMTQNNLGAAYSNRIKGEKVENLELAIQSYQAALLEATRERFPIDWAMTQNNLGAAYSNRIKGKKAENLELAIQSYQQALLVRTREALPQNHANTAYNLGLAYIDAERFADAYDIFKSAINTVEFLRGEIVSGDDVKQILAEEWNTLYRRMVEVCLKLEYSDQAVEYIERSKTRNLLELLVNQSSPQLQQLEQEIATEKRRLAATENSEPTQLNQLRQQRKELIEQVTGKQIEFAEIPKLLDNHTAIVQWYLFNDCFRAFIITRQNQSPQIWQSTAEDLQALYDWSNEYLNTYNSQKPRWRYQLAAKLQELADILHINDVLALVPETCQALILVPHRFLHLLPLHALPLAGENYLLDKFPLGVRYAPSCQLLKFAKKREYQPQSSLFAIQDPNDNLIYTNLEVETIRRHFHPTRVLQKAQATKSALLQTVDSFRDVQVVHFSCHGYFDIELPINSAIALADFSPSAMSDDANSLQRERRLADGNTIDLEKCLTLPDIFNLNLPECRLVTLSACETALTNPFSTSDEYIGLPSGFLKAGSSSVVSSLWSVDDFVTALLMIRFYDNLPSLPVAQALCAAQSWLRHATQPDLIKWTEQHPNISEENKQTIVNRLIRHYESANPNYKPFGKPAAWAGFCAIGH